MLLYSWWTRRSTSWMLAERRPAMSRGRARRTGWGCGIGAFPAGSWRPRPHPAARTSSYSGARPKRKLGRRGWMSPLEVISRPEKRRSTGSGKVEEELGLEVATCELVPLGTRRAELEIPAGLDREFQEVFLLVRPLSVKDLRLQEEEVAAVVRLQLDGVEALHEEGEIPAEEWRGGEISPVSVRLTDFVPGEDGYLLWAARAARDVLAGRGPDALL